MIQIVQSSGGSMLAAVDVVAEQGRVEFGWRNYRGQLQVHGEGTLSPIARHGLTVSKVMPRRIEFKDEYDMSITLPFRDM